jgi:hypothetical protein
MSYDIKFKSGNVMEPNCGIVGIDPDGKVSEGYDNIFHGWPPEDWHYEPTKFTADDMRELADHMIARWQKFKEGLK